MVKDIFDLKGKVVVVTGGTGLLGSKFCDGLAEFNANVVMADIDKEKLDKLSENLNEKYSAESLPLMMDITNEKSVKEGLNKILDKFAKVDVLVNSAYPRNKEWGTVFEDIRFDSWIENVNMHLGGCFLVTQIFAKQMMKQKSGNIINIGSIYGMLGPDFSIYEGTNMTNPPEYSAIKGGIINFTRYLATHLAKYNIRVNCISPGGIFDNQPEVFVKRYSEKTPLGRMAKPEDMVGGLIYLASDASSYVAGHNLVIDGGWSIL